MTAPAREPDIPGTTLFDGDDGPKGLRAQQDVLLVQRGRQPRRVPARRGRLLRAVRAERRAARGRAQPQRAGADRRRRQRLLPRQARRHLRSRRAGHRRAADRHDARTRSRRCCSPRGDDHGNDRRRHHARRTFRPSAARSPRDCSRTRTGSRSSTAFRRCTHGWREARPDVVVVFYNDHGLNFFLDKMPTFAVGAAPEYRNADEGWGIPTLRPFRGDPALSWHLIECAGRRRVRHHDVPGDAGRPRASRCRWRCCGRAAANGRCASCRSR